MILLKIAENRKAGTRYIMALRTYTTFKRLHPRMQRNTLAIGMCMGKQAANGKTANCKLRTVAEVPNGHWVVTKYTMAPKDLHYI